MRFIIRTVMLIALVWIGLLLSGYGVLIGSKENAAGLGLQCTYLTARGTSTVQYLHTKSGFLGMKWSTKTGHRVRVFPVSIFRFVWG